MISFFSYGPGANLSVYCGPVSRKKARYCSSGQEP